MGPRSPRTSNAEHAERTRTIGVPTESVAGRAGPVGVGTMPERPTARTITRHVAQAPPVLAQDAVRREPGEYDMRRKRPPAISFLLRVETARRALRVLSLLALDFTGLTLAIFTALVIKAAALGHVELSQAYEETKSILAFAYLVTALLFARSGLYAS